MLLFGVVAVLRKIREEGKAVHTGGSLPSSDVDLVTVDTSEPLVLAFVESEEPFDIFDEVFHSSSSLTFTFFLPLSKRRTTLWWPSSR